MLSPRDKVLLDYAHLIDGETINGEVCPYCKGGTSGDRSLSVSRRGGSLLWICYRASCPFRGGSSPLGSSSEARGTKVPDTRGTVGRWIAREAEGLPSEVAESLRLRYEITASHVANAGFGWDTETSRLVMPVRSYEGEELGVMLRALDDRKPKVVSHTEKGAIAWYVNRITPGVIIVEDQLSAVRASDFLTSVALLGTNLSDERVMEIKKAGLGPVYLALDNDAVASAVKYVVKYRGVLPMRLVRLDKDIKDMTHEEATALFTGIGISRL